jgi:hypothetical protein
MEKDEVWTPDKRLAYLPYYPRELFVKEAKFLYKDFIDNILDVVLIPAPIQTHTDHKIRVAESHNPPWYSEIYSATNRGKRHLFKKALERVVNEKDKDFNPHNNWYSYDTSIRGVIYSRFIYGYNEKDGSFVFPDNNIRKFFKLEPVEIDNDIEYLEKESIPNPIKKEYNDIVPF